MHKTLNQRNRVQRCFGHCNRKRQHAILSSVEIYKENEYPEQNIRYITQCLWRKIMEVYECAQIISLPLPTVHEHLCCISRLKRNSIYVCNLFSGTIRVRNFSFIPARFCNLLYFPKSDFNRIFYLSSQTAITLATSCVQHLFPFTARCWHSKQ